MKEKHESTLFLLRTLSPIEGGGREAPILHHTIFKGYYYFDELEHLDSTQCIVIQQIS
jgi:hypothetical protein